MQPSRCFVELLRRYFSSGGEAGIFANFLTDVLQKFAAASSYPPGKYVPFPAAATHYVRRQTAVRRGSPFALITPPNLKMFRE
jgi:hypothetical protein